MSDSSVPSPLPPEPSSDSAAAPVTQPAAESAGLPPNIAACLACCPLLGGIVFLIIEKKHAFVRFYAMQSTVLGFVALGCSIVLMIAVRIVGIIPLLGHLLIWLLGLVGVVLSVAILGLWIVTGLNAFTNKEWEIPYLGKIARDQLTARTPTPP
jgi:uncharacterized membrane protein